MATPVTPQMAMDEVVLSRVSINYNPTWDGVAWVLTPSEIVVDSVATLTTNDNAVGSRGLVLAATDLPPAGQAALQDLYNYIEGEIAALYP